MHACEPFHRACPSHTFWIKLFVPMILVVGGSRHFQWVHPAANPVNAGFTCLILCIYICTRSFIITVHSRTTFRFLTVHTVDRDLELATDGQAAGAEQYCTAHYSSAEYHSNITHTSFKTDEQQRRQLGQAGCWGRLLGQTTGAGCWGRLLGHKALAHSCVSRLMCQQAAGSRSCVTHLWQAAVSGSWATAGTLAQNMSVSSNSHALHQSAMQPITKSYSR